MLHSKIILSDPNRRVKVVLHRLFLILKPMQNLGYFFQSLLVWIGLSVTATEPNKTYEPSQKSDPYETSETSEASETSDIVSFYGVDSMVYPIDGIDVENSFRRI